MSRWIMVGVGLVLPLVIGPAASVFGQADESLFVDDVGEDCDCGYSEPCQERATCGSAACSPCGSARQCGPCGGLAGCRMGCCGPCCSPLAIWAQSACSMFPHYPYFPSMHGYYYFRPYHHSHIVQQQQTVAGWGGDSRNPYANEIFQTVYAQYMAEQPGTPAVPIPPLPQP
jgi:hypothetical protein